MPAAARRSTFRQMTGETSPAWAWTDEVRLLVPVFALAVAVIAALSDPSSVGDVMLMAIPVGAFVVWTAWPGCRWRRCRWPCSYQSWSCSAPARTSR